MNNTFDAIVIGSGIAGGWAAKELCEKGLKTLVLERGRDVKHIVDYPTAMLHPWEFQHRGVMPKAFTDANPITSRAWLFDESSAHFFIEDADHPYVQEKPFDWIRGYQLGGKSLTWGRASQRWSDHEFKAPAKYGYGIEWPIGYEDIAPWYSHVERFAGICGAKDGIEAMPDGEYLPPFPFNCVEAFMKKKLAEHFPDRKMIQGRWAHLSEPQDIHLQQGRGKCQCRNLCVRGCPYGGYFSSVASTLPWAEKTGNLTIRPFSVVHSINYDEQAGKATGVKVIDTNTREALEFRASIIFLNASALNTNLILLNSRSARFPNGLGNDNGLLGKYICFHNYRPSAWAVIDGFDAVYVSGRLPSGPIIPNFKNFKKRNADFLGGYMTFIGAMRPARTSVPDDQPQLGIDFKHQLSEPGDWIVYMYMMVTDCYGEKEMTIFREGIGKVQATSRHKYKRGFLKLQTQEKLALLTAFDQEARKNPEGEPIHFFTLMKQLTILGYFTSEPGVTQALRYDPIPGGYNGCEEYREGDNAWYGPLSSIG